jgi:hypothetical protein
MTFTKQAEVGLNSSDAVQIKSVTALTNLTQNFSWFSLVFSDQY